MELFKERLKELRKNRKVTQRQICEYAGIDPRNYRRYEAGQTEPLTRYTVKIADFYDISIDYLVGRSDNPERR